ncbi:myosin heavy chain, muscle [Folsomia candida]|uniref:Myosin heavy chain, muscle n=1 Tax=Folsomia candida TaxID=158441 RepID=A0A226DZT7_FOLCA|nr:myosin heavy chain, muscle [Folsomia candida]OXA50729.1 Myosin heavy chain, muscle [Folsomia candida]
MVIEQKFKPGEEPDPTEFLFVSMEMKRQDQSKPYDAKKACWVPDEKEGFVVGEIAGTKGDIIIVKVDGADKNFKKDLVGQVNPPKYEKCEDMSNLTFLNDASVLHNLRQRYYARLIYTYSGLFCIAVNPYVRFPIYTPRAMKIYQGKRRNEVPPHIFAIAEGAYQNMLQDHENQSILITGESGAGKTENTKKVIAYFANVASSGKASDSKKVSLEDQIVQTNPVLESFGNAKTTRNDNSSRFGKFIRIHFGPSGKLAGADIESYLLEKARVISQMSQERCYHIFYQLMSPNCNKAGVKSMCLLGDDIYKYHYCSQGKVTVPSIDDSEEFAATHEAFEILLFTDEERANIYRITAAVMHMGELKFEQKGRDEQAMQAEEEEGAATGKLLGIDGEILYINICKPRIKVGTEFVTKGQNVQQCNATCGALAKSMFDRLFKFLVKKCNETLDTKQNRASFSAVLDIAGFEIFEENGFDQLCINFTNEKLQQFFNHHMFVLEQEEYKKEGLDWIFEDFGMDLQATITLFEQPMGVFSILEEESMFPKATDQTFIEKLKSNHLGKSNCFLKPKPPKPGFKEGHFAVAHYAGTVTYNITGWLEKNKDPLNDTVVDQYKKGGNALICELYSDHPGQSEEAGGKGGGGGKKKGGFKTVSSGYREQLGNLMATLKATHPHFIRCIVPNEIKKPGLVDAALVMHQLTCNGVLEGIRICRKGFPNRMLYPDFKHRYAILASAQMAAEKEDKKIAVACFETIGLNADKYRVGHTKVFFRAGVLGEMEEIRDDKLGKIITWLQAQVRKYNVAKAYRTLEKQRKALEVVQRSLKSYVNLRCWPWWGLWKLIKPNLQTCKIEENMKKAEVKIAKFEAILVEEEKARAEAEKKAKHTIHEKDKLLKELDEEKNAGSNFQERFNKINAQKNELDAQLNDLTNRVQSEEDQKNQIQQQLRKQQQDLANTKKELEENAKSLEKLDADKVAKEGQIKNLNEELAHQEELISKLQKEKKQVQEAAQHTSEDVQALEDKVNGLNKIKTKLERSLDELEDSLEREKKLRGDIEKAKRKVEGDLKIAQEAVADLERNKKDVEQTVQRKDKEISSLTAKLEEEQGLIAKLQRQIKELQARIEELDEELEAERIARAKAESQRSNLARELEELGSRLEEAGSATSGQIELNKKREAELAKLRRELEETNVQHEASMAGLRKKHNDAVAEMAEQIDNLNKMKAKAEKDRSQIATELNDSRAAMDHLVNDKAGQEKLGKHLQHQMAEIQGRYEEVARNVNEVDQTKKRLALENTDMARQIEEAESNLSALGKLKVSLATQLEDTKRLADEEGRERATLLGKYRNVEHDLDLLREQLDEEAEAKSEIQKQLSRANAEAQLWRTKYENEGVARIEELEEAKRKLLARLQEAEETIESLNVKSIALEKTKQRLSSQLEDMTSEVDRSRALVIQLEKKQKYFDKIIDEWKAKVGDLQSEVDASQKEARSYATEVFRIRAAYEQEQEQLDAVKRENKNLADEIKDLFDQIGEGGRNVHEIEKARNRLQIEKEELQSALEEAEAAFEQEENKVLRVQLELSQVRQEIDRRIQEKEEEFENTRKNQQRALDSMQASLEAESKGKQEALRVKKKLETDINELEIALDHANKTNAEASKTIKRYLQQLKETQSLLEEEQRARDEAREAYGIAERRANAFSNELDESRTLLEQADRARRCAEQELHDARDQINELGNQTSILGGIKRQLDSQLQTMHADLEAILNEAKNSEEKAKKAMVDAARLADELRMEQEHAQSQERARKGLEVTMKDLQGRLEEAEQSILKGGRKQIAKLEERVRLIETELDSEQRRHSEAQKNMRRAERRCKELSFQAEEDRKNHEKMQDLVEKLQQKIKTYKRQIEEAEEVAALNLAKFRKAQQEYEEVEERNDLAEAALSKVRPGPLPRGRPASMARGMSPF